MNGIDKHTRKEPGVLLNRHKKDEFVCYEMGVNYCQIYNSFTT